MITGTVETLDVNFRVEILACRIDDDYLLCRDIDDLVSIPRCETLTWVNGEYVFIDKEGGE